MMKKIVYTQRVEIVDGYNERRDCIDQEVPKFIWECGYQPIPINNVPEKVSRYLEMIQPDGVILTGGNDLSKYGGMAPERDITEKRVIEFALDKNIPIYGFCRGMQMIADYYGTDIVKVTEHVAKRHVLKSLNELNGREVNSFHNMGIREIKEPLVVFAETEDGVVEALKHKEKEIYGTMWHPERENPFSKEDIQFVRNIFK